MTETKSASVQKLREIEHWLMLVWLVVTGLIVFGLIICWNEGLIDALIAGDKSRISLIIALLYCAGTVHCAGAALFCPPSSTSWLDSSPPRRVIRPPR